MGEETKTYKYTSNKDSQDGTEEIRLPGREPVTKGGEVELTEAEHAQLSERLNLREVKEDTGAEDSKPGAGESAQGATASADNK